MPQGKRMPVFWLVLTGLLNLFAAPLLAALL
jgi:hypothetical protein